MQALQLKRGLFGYTPESVRLLLADRDKMFIRAAEQARAAEALVLELRSEVEALTAQFEERQEALRAAEAEATDLRTDRDATRVELDRAAASVAQLTTDVEASRKELADAQELMRVADAQLARQHGDLAVLRQELGSARRDFLIQNQRARSAENRVEELEAELLSATERLEAELVSTRERLEEELRWTSEELDTARAAAASAPPAPAEAGPTAAEELSSVVEAAEQALGRVLDSARVRAEAETTPDDMAACMLAPPEVGGGSYTHVEELEVDARALSGGRVEGFLEECQLPAAAIARALQRAREVVAEFDTAVLTVELAPTRAATVIPGESVTRGAALPQPQQSAAPLLQALPAT